MLTQPLSGRFLRPCQPQRLVTQSTAVSASCTTVVTTGMALSGGSKRIDMLGALSLHFWRANRKPSVARVRVPARSGL